jgi:DUF4097 and DUF4098 domain-containing protein YvlB
MSEGFGSSHCPVTASSHSVLKRALLPTLAVVAVIFTLSACDGSFDGGDSSNKINGTVHVAAGQAAGSARTVNGSIHVDDNAAVTSAATVNGGVRLGAHATASSLRTVNGSIVLGDGAHATQGAESVNGDLTLGNDADVSGALTNVNGKIELAAAHVGGGIKTVNGSISIMGASHVEGGILVKKPSGGSFLNSQDPTIVIGPGATVQGDLRFERTVRLYVSDKATIGAVTGATPIVFTGDTPPP